MIDTIMALWNLIFRRNVGQYVNWGPRSRPKVIPVMLALLLICISISLLFVTVGSVWGSFYRHAKPGGPLGFSSITTSVTASPGSTFSGWSGACTGTGACQVTMSADEAVAATFTANAAPPPTGAPTPVLTSAPSAITTSRRSPPSTRGRSSD